MSLSRMILVLTQATVESLPLEGQPALKPSRPSFPKVQVGWE